MIDIEKIRNDAPSVKKRLFLNSAGSSIPARVVNETVISYLKEEEDVGGYKLMMDRAEEIDAFYTSAAQLIGAGPRNMAFVQSATDGFGKALSAIDFQSGDILLTTDNDYVSNFMQFDSLKKRYGIRIHRIKSLENGDLDLEDLKELLEKETPKLVAITHIPTNSGLIQDAMAVGELCKKYGVLYLLDACQSVGQIPVDVKEIGCDLLSMTGRKFMRAPRGTGFMYVSDELLDQNFAPMSLDSFGAEWVGTMEFRLKDSARRFELWEKSAALKLGMKAAIDYALDVGMQNIAIHNTQINKHLRRLLDECDQVQVLDQGSSLCNIITLRKEGVSLERFQSKLDRAEVIYSITAKMGAFIDFEKKGLEWAVRLSPHYFNTMEEMDQVADIIDRL